MVIHDALDEVEQAPADEHPAHQRASGDGSRPPRQENNARDDGDPRGRVEETVPERVRLETRDRRGRVALP
jgi:hypothetical protein